MSDRDFATVGYVAVCWRCKRAVEGTVAWAIEHYRDCVAPMREACRHLRTPSGVCVVCDDEGDPRQGPPTPPADCCPLCEGTYSYGTCGLCGHYGPGPAHDCKVATYRCERHRGSR